MNNIALSVYCTVWSRGSSISAKIDRRVSIGCSPVQENTAESLSSPHARPLLLMCDSPRPDRGRDLCAGRRRSDAVLLRAVLLEQAEQPAERIMAGRGIGGQIDDVSE